MSQAMDAKEPKEAVSSRRLTDVTEKSLLPRERALKHGFAHLSNAELLAILLGTGIKGKNVMDLSNEILNFYKGHLSELNGMSVNELTCSFAGIGRTKALLLLAAVELGRRSAQDAAEVALSRQKFDTSEACYQLMQNTLQRLDHEEFWVLLLNNSLRYIDHFRINEGASNFTVVEVKKIIKAMMDRGANRVVLYHNHPSGQLNPSAHDDNITRKIADAANLFEFRVIDHVIVTPCGYYSYADNGRL